MSDLIPSSKLIKAVGDRSILPEMSRVDTSSFQIGLQNSLNTLCNKIDKIYNLLIHKNVSHIQIKSPKYLLKISFTKKWNLRVSIKDVKKQGSNVFESRGGVVGAKKKTSEFE